MKDLLNFVFSNNLQIPVIAVITVVLTGVMKLPIKKFAAKMRNGQKLTRFITFIPIVAGFAVTVLAVFLRFGEVDFNDKFFACWLSAVSLSLAIYAFWEKFVPDERRILTQAEINNNKYLVEALKDALKGDKEGGLNYCGTLEASEKVNAGNCKKIIINNNKKEN